MRIIKKYGNRRLYDTEESRYVTFDDVKDLVLACASFQVVDAKTQENLTNSVLLQVLMGLESQGSPVFTTDILTQLIRVHGQPVHDAMRVLFTQSMEALWEGQHAFIAWLRYLHEKTR